MRPVSPISESRQASAAQSAGLSMRDIKARLLAGGFANYYLSPDLRLTSSLLYGAGHEGDGLAATFGIQHMATEIAPHHKVSLSVGHYMVVNGRHNAAYFGVTKDEAAASSYAYYAARRHPRRLGRRWLELGAVAVLDPGQRRAPVAAQGRCPPQSPGRQCGQFYRYLRPGLPILIWELSATILRCLHCCSRPVRPWASRLTPNGSAIATLTARWWCSRSMARPSI
ncbi:MipA/OmpV family protein [Massilia sp. H-1]|nr:MipA/OmpV family protein [Massilia sp. H-1]